MRVSSNIARLYVVFGVVYIDSAVSLQVVKANYCDKVLIACEMKFYSLKVKIITSRNHGNNSTMFI